MEKVLLKESELSDDATVFLCNFLKATHNQGLSTEWVNAVVAEASRNNFCDWRNLLLRYVEIIPYASPPTDTQ